MLRRSTLPPHGAICGVGGDAQHAQVSREVPSPVPKRRLPNVQPYALFTHRLHHHVYVRVRLVGVQHHCVPVLEPEFLPCKALHCSEHLVRGRPRRHREHELMSQLWRRAIGPRFKVDLTPMLFQIQIPVFQQLLLDSLTPWALTVVGLDVHLSSSIQVAEMTPDSFEVLPSPAEHLNHDFGRASRGALNELCFVMRQVVPATRPATGVAGDIEQRLPAPDVNESYRHTPVPT